MASKATIFLIALALITTGALAATAPVVDTFTATPAAPRPGERITLRVSAHDPDCAAPPCTTGCGAIIRSDIVVWSDDTGRTVSGFGTPVNDASASPWNGSITWLAPETEGTYTVRISLSDNGGMLCGGRQTRVTSLQVNVSNAQPAVIDSFEVTPQAVPAGGTATVSVAAHDDAGRSLTYVFAADAGTVTQASPTTPTATWTAPSVAGAVAIRCTVYADGGTPASAQTTAIVQLGSWLRSIPASGLRITRVASLPDGRVAVVDGANGLLSVMTTSGRVSWTRTGLETPVAITSIAEELYVLERGASRISVWSSTGSRLREVPITTVVPGQLVAGPWGGALAFADIAAARIYVISAADGSILRVIGDGLLKAPSGLATSNGRLAVADAAAARVYIFDPSGAITTIIGSDSSLVRPQGLAWDASNGRLVAADAYSGELNVFAEDGTLLGTLAGFGGEEGKLVNPIDVTLLAEGTLAATTGSSEISLYQLRTTLLPVAAPASVVAADRISDDGGAVDVSWSKSSDDPARVTAYRIERATENAESFEIVGSVAKGTTSFVDTSLPDTICRRYRVVATDGVTDAESEPSACVAAVNDLAPAPPAYLTATADTPFNATLEWGASASTDLHSYATELRSGTSAPSVTRVPAGVTSITFGDLQPETRYDIEVRAIDVAGNSSPAVSSSFTTLPNEPPPAPASVVATDAKSGGAIDVTWSVPVSNVAIDRYRVTCTPSIEGWPAHAVETTETSAHFPGLTNNLSYSITVTTIGTSRLESEPSAPSIATPTSPARTLPVVAESSPIEDASGVAIEFSFDGGRRTIRFQYLADHTALQPFIDGTPFGAPLRDTAGTWVDAEIELDARSLAAGTHRLELRSTSFPDPAAQLQVRRIDFVPLAPAKPSTESFNTVVDLLWDWPDTRHDLGIQLTRDGVAVPCTAPQSTRCREILLENNRRYAWTLTLISPAGWAGPSRGLEALPAYGDAPPPVTDLTFTALGESLRLEWSPLSSAIGRNEPAQRIVLYRIYAAGALIGEVTAPPAQLSNGADASTIVVRSVDAAGRESQ